MPKQNSYTVTKKLEVIQWLRRNGDNIAATSREFGIDRKRIREWRDTEDNLRLHSRGKDASKKRIGKIKLV